MTSKADYLKRYLEGGTDTSAAAEKKKKKKKKAIVPGGISIIDYEIKDWQHKKAGQYDEDAPPEEDEAPVLEGAAEIQAAPKRPIGQWVVVDEGDASPPRRGRHDSPDASPPRRGRHDSPDASPPRRGRHDSPDASPPRRGRHDSPDASPPRRGRHDSPDASPPRRQRHDSPDASPPRRGRQASLDASPPRRRPAGDSSPPRRQQRHDSPDASPPRRRGASSPGDASPPRRGRHDSPDASPPRRRPAGGGEGDSSPPRKRGGAAGSPEASARGRDASPPRRRAADDRDADGRPRMTDGSKAGLLTGAEVMEDAKARAERERERMGRLTAEQSGRGAETVYRDKSGKRVDEFMESRKKKKVEHERPEWGGGLAQMKEAEERRAALEKERSRPFARYANDAELDADRKRVSRWGDPLAGLVKDKPVEALAVPGGNEALLMRAGFKIPTEIPPHSWIRRKLGPPANRYNIKPGRHWDGVDRSNGFEQQMFKMQNDKNTRERDMRQWVTSQYE